MDVGALKASSVFLRVKLGRFFSGVPPVTTWEDMDGACVLHRMTDGDCEWIEVICDRIGWGEGCTGSRGAKGALAQRREET
jgi:hypothetical protein